MGICWSEPPVHQTPVAASYGQPCKRCGVWNSRDYCEKCLQQNAMSYIAPSAPPMQPQYTYAVMPQQQQQMYAYYQRPYGGYPPQPPQQMGVGTAMVGGFVLGTLAADILDPTD